MTAEVAGAALALFHALDEPAAVLDLGADERDVTIVAVNGALAAAFDVPAETFVGAPGSRFYPEEEFHDVLRHVRTAVHERRTVTYEATRHLPQGRRTVAGTVVATGGRRAVVVGRDVSGEREAGRQLGTLERIAHIGSYRWNVAENTLEWSDEYRRILGVDPAEPPSFDRLFSLVHPDDCALVSGRMDDVVDGEAPTPSTRFRIVRPDGTTRTVEGRAEVLRDQDGTTLHISGILQDITEQVEQLTEAQRWREIERRQRQALELNDDVVQGLTAAWLALQLEELDRAAEIIARTTAAAQQLVSNLLRTRAEGPIAPGDLARAEASNRDVDGAR